VSCSRAQEFLGKNKARTETTVDAKKIRIAQSEALKMVLQVDHLYVAKGAKIVHFDMRKDNPGEETILAHVMGPTGNLRAPTLRVGNNLLVGFNDEMYASVFNQKSFAKSHK
jgi:hypothetical protein